MTPSFEELFDKKFGEGWALHPIIHRGEIIIHRGEIKAIKQFFLDYLQTATREAVEAERKKPKDGETSDGYHTFNELYEHRHTMFSILCRDYHGWKSKLHDNGTMFNGWFIAGIETPLGQTSYHLPIDWWGKFECRELDKAPKWDGHTPNDVLTRLLSLSTSPTTNESRLTNETKE